MLSSMRDAPINQVIGPTEHNDSTAISDIQLASATAVSPDICNIAKQVMT
jgi:hypothetical protein